MTGTRFEPREEALAALNRIRNLDGKNVDVRTRFATASAILDLADAVRSLAPGPKVITDIPIIEKPVHALRTCSSVQPGETADPDPWRVTCSECLANRAKDVTFEPGAINVAGVPAEERRPLRDRLYRDYVAAHPGYAAPSNLVVGEVIDYVLKELSKPPQPPRQG